MIIIFDLDYTLLDTKKFKICLAEALEISWKVFQESYLRLGFDGLDSYSIDKHLDYLVDQGFMKSQDKKSALERVSLFLKDVDSFLFPEAFTILLELKKGGHKLILLTYGDPAWQKAKIKNLKIKNFFQKIIITNQSKDKKICFSRSKNEEVIFINDNARELLTAKKKWPSIGCILVKGPYSNNANYNFNKYRLKDIVKVIKKYED